LTNNDSIRYDDGMPEPRTDPSQRHPVPGKSQFEVDTPDGFQPFVPPAPQATSPTGLFDDEGNPVPDNPENPRGGPSLSLPQQATPLTSQQGVAPVEDIVDLQRQYETMTLQDGLAPDDPFNPKGTPDYIVEDAEAQDPDPSHQPAEQPPPYQSYEDQAKINVAMTEAEADLAEKSRKEVEAARGKQH
jgi:hypothetical protein